MELKTKFLDIQAGEYLVALLNEEDADELGLKAVDRIRITSGEKEIVAILDIATETVKPGELGIYKDLKNYLGEPDQVEVIPALKPKSVRYITDRIRGRMLQATEHRQIVKDVMDRSLSFLEIAAFITSLEMRPLSLDEAEAVTRAMVDLGESLEWDKHPIFDKHSIGGVPGDKTTMLLVPVIASLGYTIPKTSSRAITSPAGTADRVEILCPVELELEEIREVVAKTNGCMAWGGAVDLAPADDLFIQVEYPLSIDPLYLPSVLGKKKAAGADYVVIDLPTGKGAKLSTVDDANEFGRDFIRLGRKLGLSVQCGITFGEQPIGRNVGPALEAKEALATLMNPELTPDLVQKVASLSGILLGMNGVEDAKELALESLRSGQALQKMREIIEAQGGDPTLKPEDIPVGECTLEIESEKSGEVFWIDNTQIVSIARSLGAPSHQGSGVCIPNKVGDLVKKGDPILKLYADKTSNLSRTAKMIEELEPVMVAEKLSDRVLIGEVAELPETTFILER
jgi:AMP phosphorylase